MTLGIKRSVLQHWCINQVKTLLSLAVFHFNLRGEEAQGEGTRSLHLHSSTRGRPRRGLLTLYLELMTSGLRLNSVSV